MTNTRFAARNPTDVRRWCAVRMHSQTDRTWDFVQIFVSVNRRRWASPRHQSTASDSTWTRASQGLVGSNATFRSACWTRPSTRMVVVVYCAGLWISRRWAVWLSLAVCVFSCKYLKLHSTLKRREISKKTVHDQPVCKNGLTSSSLL